MADRKLGSDPTIFGGVDYASGSYKGDQFDASQAAFEHQQYEIDSQRRAREERQRIAAVRAETERKQRATAEALQRQRDEEAREAAERLKSELRTKYLSTGLMTSDEFEKEWPRIKKEYLDEQVRERERAMEAAARTGDYDVL